MSAKLTPAMLRELRNMERDGQPSDPYDWSHAPAGLWFHARERVITALLKRGLIFSDERLAGYSLTDAGRAELLAVLELTPSPPAGEGGERGAGS